MPNQKEQIELSNFKVVFPCNLNDNNTLFGGEALKWMDELAYITAKKLVGKKMVTASISKISFIRPILSGTIAEIKAKVIHIGKVKVEIMVQIITTEDSNKVGEKAVEGIFTFVAINNKHKPIPLKILPQSYV